MLLLFRIKGRGGKSLAVELPLVEFSRSELALAAFDFLLGSGYFPMQSVKLIDNQSVTKVWFIYGSIFSKFFGNLEIQ